MSEAKLTTEKLAEFLERDAFHENPLTAAIATQAAARLRELEEDAARLWHLERMMEDGNLAVGTLTDEESVTYVISTFGKRGHFTGKSLREVLDQSRAHKTKSP